MGLLPGSVWALRFGALIVGERAREREMIKQINQKWISLSTVTIFSH